MTTHCKCGKGHASQADGQCKFCRESCWSRAEAKSVGVKHRGDWTWFGDRPEEYSDRFDIGHDGYEEYSGMTGEVLGDWRDTLEQRPADLKTWLLLTYNIQSGKRSCLGVVSSPFRPNTRSPLYYTDKAHKQGWVEFSKLGSREIRIGFQTERVTVERIT